MSSDSSYNVSKIEVVIISVLIPGVDLLLQLCGLGLREFTLSFFTSDHFSHFALLPIIGMFVLFSYVFLLFIFSTSLDLFQEPSNSSNLVFSYTLFALGVIYTIVLVYCDYEPDQAHQLRNEDYVSNWRMVCVMFLLSLTFFLHYDSESSKEEDVEREASFYDSGVCLTTKPTEWEATEIKHRLEQEGIRAELDGTQGAGFGDPLLFGEVRVFVEQKDLEAAQNLLDQIDDGPDETQE